MRNWRLILLVLVAGGAVAYFGPGRGLLTSAAPTGARAPAPAIPVMASKAERTDIPIELAGLGTVQALNSVLVRSRVDGQIVKINYSEGKDVHPVTCWSRSIRPHSRRPWPGAGQQAQGSGAARQCPPRPRSGGPAGQVRGDQHPAARYTESPGGAARRQREGRSGRDRQAQVQLDYSHIRSPIDGRAGTRLVDAGNIVHATDLTGMVTINEIHPIFVDFAFRPNPAADPGRIEEGRTSR